MYVLDDCKFVRDVGITTFLLFVVIYTLNKNIQVLNNKITDLQ